MEFRFIMYNYHKKVTVCFFFFFQPYSGDSQAKTSVESKGEKRLYDCQHLYSAPPPPQHQE